MQVNITFRGMDSTEALKSHVKERVEHVARHLDRAIEAHAVLSVERYLHQADIHIHAGPYSMRGSVKTEDMYKSIDESVDKIERQLKRYKERLQTSKVRARDDAQSIRVKHEVFQAPPEVAEGEQWAEGPKVVRSDEYLAAPMTVDEAVMQMDLLNAEFLVFKHAQTGQVNLVYRRKDGHFGLLEVPK